MRAALIIAGLLVMALSAALVVRAYRRQVDAPTTPEVCAARAAVPPPLLPELSTVPLVVNAPGVTLRLDGGNASERLTPGVHRLEASAPETRGASLELKVSSTNAVLLDARVVDGAVTVLVLGARCSSCDVAGTDIDLRHAPRALGNGSDAAIALASGAWGKAAEALRAVPDEERDAKFLWLQGVLYALAGQPTKSVELLQRLPASDAFHAEHARWTTRTTELPAQRLSTATQRWNATTDRFERITSEFSVDAPEVMTGFTQRYAALSEKLNAGLAAHDAIETEAALDEATGEVTNTLAALRALHDDCAWQRRVSGTF